TFPSQPAGAIPAVERNGSAWTMSAQFEHIVVLCVMALLVALFTWIYLRDRQWRVALWMIGWIAILIHFAAACLLSFSLISPTLQLWLAHSTLVFAGTSFFSRSRARAPPPAGGSFSSFWTRCLRSSTGREWCLRSTVPGSIESLWCWPWVRPRR